MGSSTVLLFNTPLVLALFGGSIPTSLLIFPMFFRSFYTSPGVMLCFLLFAFSFLCVAEFFVSFMLVYIVNP